MYLQQQAQVIKECVRAWIIPNVKKQHYGLEFLLVHKPLLWKEIQNVISAIDAKKCRTKISKERTMKGEILFSPIDMNDAFKRKALMMPHALYQSGS